MRFATSNRDSRDLETQANAIEIFGQRPVAPLGQLFGQIATDVSGLDEQLDGIATEMGQNEAALTANAESLGALADLVRAYKGRLQPAAIDAGIDDARRLLLITLALFIGWTAVPALGSLIVGRWMRKLVEPDRGSPAVPPAEPPSRAADGRLERLLTAQRTPVEPDPLPAEPFRGGVPRKQDEDLEGDRQTRRRRAGPRPEIRPGQRRHLEHSLRPHDDLSEGERVVGERREQLAVERAGPGVALPALAGRDDLVDAVRGQGRDEPIDVAPVLGDRVADPEALDPAELRRVERPAEPILDGRPRPST